MKRQRKEVSALDLRRAMPEIALRMETDHLLHEAQKLGLVVTVTRGKKIARIGIELTHYHTLRLSPVDKGAHGYGEWLTFMNHSRECDHKHPEYMLRAHAEIIDQFGPEGRRVESITVVGTSIDMVLREAIGAYEFITGKGLAPRFHIEEGDN